MSLARRVAELPRPLLIALDVDGTLAPIVDDPDAASIPEPILRTLETLADQDSIEAALITGRDLASLARMAPIEGIWRGVEHGAVVVAPGEEPRRRPMTATQQRALERFRKWASEHVADAFVESKPGAIAIHVRVLAQRDPARAEAVLAQAEAAAQALGLHVREGRSVREAEVERHDKGAALQEIYARTAARGVFFAGDDITDMPAIDFATSHGVGAFVVSEERPEPPSTSAFAIEGVAAMARVLAELVDRLS